MLIPLPIRLRTSLPPLELLVHPKAVPLLGLAILVFIIPSCATSRRDPRPEVLCQLLGTDSRFAVDSVAVAPDVLDSFSIEAQRADPRFTREAVEKILLEVKSNVSDQMESLAINAGLGVAVGGSSAPTPSDIKGTFRIDALTLVPRSETKQGWLGLNGGGGVGADGTSSFVFSCSGTFSAARDGVFISRGRGLGQVPLITSTQTSTEASAQGGATLKTDSATSQGTTLGAPTKEVVRQAVNDAWQVAWMDYSERVGLASKGPSGAESTSASLAK